MENNEPEIDAAIAEQDAIRRMRWDVVLAVMPDAYSNDDAPDVVLSAAEFIVDRFVKRFGVVK